jgi:soluble lytic murein transglycosylase-like protein
MCRGIAMRGAACRTDSLPDFRRSSFLVFLLALSAALLLWPHPAMAVNAVEQNPGLTRCIVNAARHYQLPEPLIWLILDVEGGIEGTVSLNTNGTQDLGPMQINTRWLPQITAHYREPESVLRQRLIGDGCFNVAVGTWILRLNIDNAGGDVWRGVAWYHSRTPDFARRYLARVLASAERWYGKKIEADIDF